MVNEASVPAIGNPRSEIPTEYTDELTGLYNRAWLNQNLPGIIEQNPGNCGLFFIDIDNLKTTNDRYGHLAGDQVIKSTAETIDAKIRHPSDDRAADTRYLVRLQGDELIFILIGINNAEAMENVKCRIQNNLAEVDIAASVGYAYRDEATEETASDLLHQADLAMLEDKDARKRAKIEQLPTLKRLAAKIGAKLLKFAGVNPPRQ